MIEERVSPLVSASLELVLLRAGDYAIACPRDQVAAMVTTPESQPWGSLEKLLGLHELEPVGGVVRQYLKIQLQQQTVFVSVPSPPSLVRLETHSIYPLPKLLRQHCRLPGLVALGALDQGESASSDQWLLIFDFRQL